MPERIHHIHSISFQPNGDVAIEYVVPRDDVKVNGLMHQHAVIIPADDDYDDEIENVQEAAQHLLLDVLDDLKNLPALELEEPNTTDDDDDEDDD